MIIFVALTICRLLVNCDCHWFTSLDKQIVTNTVFISSMLIVIISRIIIFFAIRENPVYVSYVIYLSSLTVKQAIGLKYPFSTTFPLLLLLIVSFLLELCISIKIKKLPWTSMKSITLGHIFMGMVIIAPTFNYNGKFFPIQTSLLILSLQTLYALKYRTHSIKVLKRFCCNETTNSVVPGSQDLQLDDIGIFVGPQRILINNFFLPSFVEEVINNPGEPNIVGEEINSPDVVKNNGEVENNLSEPDIIADIINNPNKSNIDSPNREIINNFRGSNTVVDDINNLSVLNHVDECINSPSGQSLVSEVISNIAIISDVVEIESVYLEFGGVYIGTPEKTVHSTIE